MHYPRFVLVLAALLAGFCASDPASAETRDVPIGATTVRLIAPAGQCFLEASQAKDAQFIGLVSGLLAQVNMALVGATADCVQREAWHKSPDALLDDFVEYQIALANMEQDLAGDPAPHIRPICAYARQQGDQYIADNQDAIANKIEQALDGVKSKGMSFLGVLGEERDACYYGILQRLGTQIGTEKLQLDVTAVTVVRGKLLFFNLYSVYQGPETVERMFAQQKINVKALIEANQGE